MTGIAIFLLVAGLLIAIPFVRRRLKRARQKEWMARPFPEEWDSYLRETFPRYVSLPEHAAEKLQQTMQVFLEEKGFEACGDLDEVTEEMKILIAAQACLLLVGLEKHDFYSKLRSILVYPVAFHDRGRRRFDLHQEQERSMLGESWSSGSVILSWKSVRMGAKNDDDGMNVVIHEFAHQLDQADGAADGVPILSDRKAYNEWSRIFQREYEELVEDSEDRRADPLLDTYGAENPAEFFSVSTETFFEESEEMEEEHPELYAALKKYYGLDPARWV